MLLYRALIHEIYRENDKAIARLQEIIKIFPERTALNDRISELRKGDKPSLLATFARDDMLQNDAKRNTCKALERKTDIDSSDDEHDSAHKH
jgi:hypothetical protein